MIMNYMIKLKIVRYIFKKEKREGEKEKLNY